MALASLIFTTNLTRSLATAEKQRVSYACLYLGWLTDRAMYRKEHRRIAEESLAYIFVADSMGLSSFKFVQWALKDASFLRQSAFWPFKVIQGRPRSMILVPVERAYATSY